MKFDHAQAALSHSQMLMAKMAPKPQPQQQVQPQAQQAAPAQPQQAPQPQVAPQAAKPDTQGSDAQNLASMIKDLFAKEKAEEEKRMQELAIQHEQDLTQIKDEISTILHGAK